MAKLLKNRRIFGLLTVCLMIALVFSISGCGHSQETSAFMKNCFKIEFADSLSAEHADLQTYLSVRPDGETAVKEIMPYVKGDVKVSVGENSEQVLAVGTSDEYSLVANLKFKAGRFFLEKEVSKRRRSAVITASLAEKLFGEDDALTQEITINNDVYTVVGIIKKGVYATADADEGGRDVVFVPYTTGRVALKSPTPLQYIVSSKNKDKAKENIKNYLKYKKVLEEEYTIK